MRMIVSLVKQKSKEKKLMEKRVKKDKISFRQAENQPVKLRIVLTANDRKPNSGFQKYSMFFFTKQKS